ncbi:uncharacterized protein MONBRDRAFT_38111 [Monosiga brevicollis MX1]|uniref:Autophagy-related protein n=1 Tax=Monosiga brevicollis TaxID=81824 RepID=A9V5R5_MONBE|nr:uncharacterized protein MONBRDRAFT_38111 [Monosiga brevicollis MX1]EDQ87163.1 predicted protein [Monosiga brevicollis MX1]|eukprot:XP_001748106.1 hypothetical protein [Monosiga brevicollis MX1]
MSKSTAFKAQHAFETRLRESEKILQKYPDKVPVIIEPAKRCTLSEIDKKKYLVPEDLTVAQFQFVIRKRMNIKPDKAVYIAAEVTEGLTVKHEMLMTTQAMSVIYEHYKDEDGFLYLKYSGDNAFGAVLSAC